MGERGVRLQSMNIGHGIVTFEAAGDSSSPQATILYR